MGGAPPSVTYVPLDLAQERFAGALARHGYDTAQRTFVIMEGSTMYVPEEGAALAVPIRRGARSGYERRLRLRDAHDDRGLEAQEIEERIREQERHNAYHIAEAAVA